MLQHKSVEQQQLWRRVFLSVVSVLRTLIEGNPLCNVCSEHILLPVISQQAADQDCYYTLAKNMLLPYISACCLPQYNNINI